MALGLRNKTIYVYGLGRSGQASVRALLEEGARVLAWDDRETSLSSDVSGFSHSSIERVAPSEVHWDEIDAVLKSPGIDDKRPLLQGAHAHNVPILGDIDLLYRRNPDALYIGITGTNGKSTVTALIAHVLRSAGYTVAAGGNLGQPALSLPQLGENEFYVLELSSYQLDLIQELKLDSALVLNLSPDHLDRYGSMENYAASKMHIFDCCTPTSTRILGIDHPLLDAYAARHKVMTLTNSGKNGEYRITTDGKLMHKGRQIADLSYFTHLAGPHNWQNLASAMLTCQKWLKPDDFWKHARTFLGLPHRMERVQEVNDILFVNDSKATNPESAIAALQSYNNIYWIVGGRAKAEGITPCLSYLDGVRAAFVIGEAEASFSEALEEVTPVFRCGSLEVAVRQAYAAARQEDLAQATVLLSPACASFDQFDSFEQRGDAFAVLCRQLDVS